MHPRATGRRPKKLIGVRQIGAERTRDVGGEPDIATNCATLRIFRATLYQALKDCPVDRDRVSDQPEPSPDSGWSRGSYGQCAGPGKQATSYWLLSE